MPANFGNIPSQKVTKPEKPKGMISEGGKDLCGNDSNPTDSIKIGVELV